MKLNKRKNKWRIFKFFVLILLFIGAGWYINVQYHLNIKNIASKVDQKTNNNKFFERLLSSYQDKKGTREGVAGGIYDLQTGEQIEGWKENISIVPASLNKLFVIGYTSTVFKLDDVIRISQDTLNMVPAGSSLANLRPGNYTVKQIYEAMLLPSGNDAAYAIAVACSKKIDNSIKTSRQAFECFIPMINKYLKQNGFFHTKIVDPAGYSQENISSVSDLAKQSSILMKNQWFAKIVSQYEIKERTPFGHVYKWFNTNEFLNPKSIYYNDRVKGIKTGSIKNWFNLIIVYKGNKKDVIIISVGLKDDLERYEDIRKLLTVAEANY